MNFTTEPPTTPGFYAWRLNQDHPIETIHIVSDDNPESNGAARIGRYLSLRETHGEWCRLVPAEEVARAFYEGMEAYASEEKNLWNDSRAKQVAEGEL